MTSPAARTRPADGAAPSGYAVPDFPAPIDLNLSLNECAPASRELAEIIAQLPPDAACRYPDASPLEAALAARLGVEPGRVIVTTGGDDAIDRLVRYAVLKRDPGRRVLVTHAPTFPIIPIAAANAGAEVAAPEWLDGTFPEADIAERLDHEVAMLALVSPNNPTGREIEPDALGRLCERAAAAGALAMVDLAYVEFADRDPTPSLLGFDHVVMIRTLSKAWGLAGLRLGYAVGPPDLIAAIRAMGGPFPASSLSVAIGLDTVTRREDAMRSNVAGVESARSRVVDAVARAGGTAIPSAANFVLAAFPDDERVWGMLAERGIGVRRYPGSPLLAGRLRITCPPSTADADRLVAALDGIAAEINR